MNIVLQKSPLKTKKYRVYIDDKHIDFGAKGYEDMTMHNNPKRKQLYINRHKKRENWSKSGYLTAGFWSRWLLWNKNTIEESMESIDKILNPYSIHIVY